jgi:hypothetical protein
MLTSLIALARSGSPDVPDWKWPVWSGSDERYTVMGNRMEVARLNGRRMDWLAAHTPAEVAQPLLPERPGVRD